MKRLTLAALFVVIASAAFAAPVTDGKTVGPILTYSDRTLDKISIYIYTEEKEIIGIYVSNNLTNYTYTEGSKQKNHEIKIRIAGCNFLYYRIISNNREIKGLGGYVNLPTRSVNRILAFGNTVGSMATHAAMSGIMHSSSPQLVVNMGNIVADSVSLSAWDEYVSAGGSLYAGIPFAPVVGTRDFYSSVWKRLFDVSNRRNPFYSYTFPNFTLVVLNGAMYFAKDSVQYNWLLEELKRADPAKWIIVALHQNPLQTAGNPVATDIAAALQPLLKQFKVKLVLTGSDYCYKRSVFDGVTYVNAGGGGNYLYAGNAADPNRQFVEAAKNTFSLIDVYESSMLVRAYDATGKVIDETVLRMN